ncbi:MAG TPA: lactonase family protein [Bryobacteraceae bacterium]
MHTPEKQTSLSRRALLKSAALLTATGSAAETVLADPAPPADDDGPTSMPILAYVGAYTPNGQGIYLFSLNPANGKLTQVKVAAAIPSPSWMAIHPNGKYLYAVNEISNFNGTTTGSVTSLSINRTTGDLTLLNVVSSQGSGPAHLSVDPLGQYVFVANYGGGNIAVLPIQPNGSLGNATDTQQDVGSVGPTHATNAPPGSFAISGHDAPHAHMIQADPAGKFVLHTDLGQDRIYSWLLNRATGKLTPNATKAFTSVPPGDGPRHFAFHPNGQWLYSLQEEASTLLFFTYDAPTGVLTQQQMVSTLPAGFAGTNFTSEVRVSSDGKLVYAANRLHDTIAVFSVGASGRLTPVGESSTLGDYPRSFTIDPTSRFLFSCNQRSDDLTTFRVNGEGNAESPHSTGQYTPVGSPAVIVFLT